MDKKLPTISEFVASLETDNMYAKDFLNDLTGGSQWEELKGQVISKKATLDIGFAVSRRFVHDMHEFGGMYKRKTFKEIEKSTAGFIKDVFKRATELGFEINPVLVKKPLDLGSWMEAGEVSLG
jgi:hypothetical protein